jgi:potassium intermediate/small conductance calcium-activated channel subfamily N protein 2
MFPRTLPGRILVFFLCIWGVFMVSLMVVALTNKVSLSNSELKALNIYRRIVSKEEYEHAASKIVCNLMRYHIC